MASDFTTNSRPPISGFVKKILEELNATLVERGANYSDFEDNAAINQNIAATLGFAQLVVLPSSGVSPVSHTVATAVEMIRGKLSRLACNGWDHRDSWIDIAGYALLVAAVQDRQRVKDAEDKSKYES